MSKATRIITLLTDFGTADHYVGVMKGVMLRITPGARFVDITHDIAPQNILAGAFTLRQTIDWFPPGTVHLAVVDPGVGASRRIIAGRWGAQIVVAPDNGLVSLIQQRAAAEELRAVTNTDCFPGRVSSTFHGRDVMAPVAARLADGLPLSAVGPAVERPVLIGLPAPRQESGRLCGQVIHADHFGNLITNLSAEVVEGCGATRVEIGGHTLPVRATYSDEPAGTALAVIGSADLLEISVNQGNARSRLQARVGDRVFLTK